MYIFISGGSKGMGKAVAGRFMRQGWNAAVCARSVADLKKMKTEYARLYPKAELWTLPADVTDRKAVNEMARAVEKKWGAPDVLVNNAGTFIPGGVQTEKDGVM